MYQNPDWYPRTQIGIQEAKTRVGVQLAKSVSSKNYYNELPPLRYIFI